MHTAKMCNRGRHKEYRVRTWSCYIDTRGSGLDLRRCLFVRQNRGLKRWSGIVAVHPGPGHGADTCPIHMLMKPMVEELQRLLEEGMPVTDPYLHKSYTMRVVMGLVSVDSPARMTLDHAVHIRSKRCDWRSRMMGETGGMSYMSATLDKGGKATRFVGYNTPVVNAELAALEGAGAMLANDERLKLTGAEMVALATAVEQGWLSAETTGRHGLSPLAALKYFDPCWHYPIPLIHAGIYGVLKVSY
jgi:hypothetical protein